MRKRNRLAPLVIALLILAALPCPAAAQQPNGSITIRLTWQGQPMKGGSVTLYSLSGIELEAYDAETADRLAQYAAEHGIGGREERFDASGTVRFGELTEGAYLLVQERACDGFLPFRPFLLAIPMQLDDRIVYDVDASPKAAPEPWSPPPPGLPQTGQTNWPVPVLAGLGMVLVAVGLWIRERDRHEG